MKDFIKVMKALSDPNRVKIIKILGVKELCVCELQTLLELAQPTVSKHLKILEEAGLIVSRKAGSWVFCRLTEKAETAYAEVLLNELKDWLADDPEILEMIKKLPSVDREQICAA